MSHTDYISQIAPGFEISAHTADCPVATAENADKNLYAIQFHPEVLHTAEGTTDAFKLRILVSVDAPETGRWMHS